MAKINKVLWLVLSLFICYLAGAAGSVFTNKSVLTWFAGLEKPLFMPPSWAFGVAWTLIFTLLGISLWLVLISKEKFRLKQSAFVVFGCQWIFNVAWSIIFFGMQRPLFALFDMALLFVSVVATAMYFKPFSKSAAWLFIPYILWLCAAAYLNISIYLLNY